MTVTVLRAAAALVATAIATPLLAQTPPPAPPAGAERTTHNHRGMFGTMSPEGQAIMRETMRDTAPASFEAIKAARQRVLTLLDANRLDVDAVRRAQAEERNLVLQQHQRRQEAMLSAYQRLSTADRKAFVTAMREMEARMGSRMKHMRKHMQDRPGQPGGQ